jgi:hypothetical protein
VLERVVRLTPRTVTMKTNAADYLRATRARHGAIAKPKE